MKLSNQKVIVFLKIILSIGLLYTWSMFFLNFFGKYPLLGTISLFAMSVLCIVQVVVLFKKSLKISIITLVLILIFSILLLISIGPYLWWQDILATILCSVIGTLLLFKTAK